MFWDESQFPLAIFILKGVKCLCKFHQVTCWCFSSNRCSSWNVPSMREQSEALWVPWGGAVSEAEAGGTSWGEGSWRQWCTSGYLPAPDTLILHYRMIFCSSVFKDARDTSQAALFHHFFHVYTIGFNWVPRGSTKSEVPGQHRAPLTSGFRRKQSWMRNSFLPGISCLGPGKVVRDSNLNYELSVSIKIPPI